jgi:hypothetical protein
MQCAGESYFLQALNGRALELALQEIERSLR